MMQHGIFPELIVGTSVGALNGTWPGDEPYAARSHQAQGAMAFHGIALSVPLKWITRNPAPADGLRVPVCQRCPPQGDAPVHRSGRLRRLAGASRDHRHQHGDGRTCGARIHGHTRPLPVGGDRLCSICGRRYNELLRAGVCLGPRRAAHTRHRGSASTTGERGWHTQAGASARLGSAVPPGGVVYLTRMPGSGVASRVAPGGPHL